MKVLLVNPPQVEAGLKTLRDEICFQNVAYTPFPLRLAQAAAALGGRAECAVLDANALGLGWEGLRSCFRERESDEDLVVVESAPGLLRHDLRAATIAKEEIGPSVRTALIETGVAPIYPERVLADFPALDFVLRGLAEQVLPLLAASLDDPARVPGIAYRAAGGAAALTPLAEPVLDLDRMPVLPYELFPMKQYTVSFLAAPMFEKTIPGVRLRTTRDCPYLCPFCIMDGSRERGYDGKWKAMSAPRVLAELDRLVTTTGLKGVFFWDENFTLDKRRAREICEGMRRAGFGLTWRCLTRMDLVEPDLLREMASAGCRMVEYGLEAGEPGARKLAGKHFPDSMARDAARWTQAAGMCANVDFIVGLPWETRETLAATAKLAKGILADGVHLTMAFPYPGTAFHRSAHEKGLLLADDFYTLMVDERVRVGAKPYVRSEALTADELEAGWARVRREIDRHYLVHRVLLNPRTILRYLGECGGPRGFVRLVLKGARSIWKALRSAKV